MCILTCGMNLTLYELNQRMERIITQLRAKKVEATESSLTFGIVAVSLLVLCFVGAGVYVLISTFFS